MDSDLILPGDIPGLLRRGSPVIRGLHRGGLTHLSDAGWQVVIGDPPLLITGSGVSAGNAEWNLDLTDATGRAHAAWWLAGEANWWSSRNVAAWQYLPDMSAIDPHAWGIGGEHWWPSTHDALRDLDPNDPRTLDDGSRWVDAEALRRIVMFVAGRS